MFKDITILILAILLLCSIPCIASAAFKLPDTGQTSCYQAAYPFAAIPCAGTGQDGAYNINPMSFTDNSNGTVTDNNTGLMWQKEDDNQTYNWYQASGTNDATYNPSSQSVCGSLNLGGHTDWRLPSKKELISIVDYSVFFPNPSIKTSYFPNTHTDYYWASTATANITPGGAWNVNFTAGDVGGGGMEFLSYVRCVRGGETAQSFIDNHNGTVTDNRTGLTWQQGEPGKMTWAGALSYCEGLSLGGHSDWWLPNAKELESLTDDSRYYPTIDTAFFPGTQTSDYLTSTTDVIFPHKARNVNFFSGGSGTYTKGSSYNVRCVRSGQPVTLSISVTGQGTVISSPQNGSAIACTDSGSNCATTFPQNSVVNLTATPSGNYFFSSWGGACTGDSPECNLTMDGDKNVTASFSPPKLVRFSDIDYLSFTDAYNATQVGGAAIFHLRDMDQGGGYTLYKYVALTLKGGCDSNFTQQAGAFSYFASPFIVAQGSLVVDGVVVK